MSERVPSPTMSERIPDGTVTIAGAAAELGVSRRTTERYIATGRVKAVKTHTGRVYVHQDSIAHLLQPVPVAPAEGGEQP